MNIARASGSISVILFFSILSPLSVAAEEARTALTADEFKNKLGQSSVVLGGNASGWVVTKPGTATIAASTMTDCAITVKLPNGSRYKSLRSNSASKGITIYPMYQYNPAIQNEFVAGKKFLPNAEDKQYISAEFLEFQKSSTIAIGALYKDGKSEFCIREYFTIPHENEISIKLFADVGGPVVSEIVLEVEHAVPNFFVTSEPVTKGGDLGGLAGADSVCQAAALKSTGHPALAEQTWVAFLSGKGKNAYERIGKHSWVNVKGDLVAESSEGLKKDGVERDFAVTEKGELLLSGTVMLTGIKDAHGDAADEDHTCKYWTNADIKTAPAVGNLGSNWSAPPQLPLDCSPESLKGAHLYCFAVEPRK